MRVTTLTYPPPFLSLYPHALRHPSHSLILPTDQPSCLQDAGHKTVFNPTRPTGLNPESPRFRKL